MIRESEKIKTTATIGHTTKSRQSWVKRAPTSVSACPVSNERSSVMRTTWPVSAAYGWSAKKSTQREAKR